MAREYLISDFLKRIKRPVTLEDQVDYKLVTVKMNHNGVVLRENKKGAEIKSTMFLVKTGDFILSGIDARNGAFGIIPAELNNAIVTNDFWYFEIDEEIILKELFLELTATTWFDEICKKGSDGTTQRIRLQKDKFFNQTVLLPEKEKQANILKKIRSFKQKLEILKVESETQNKSLTKLRQNILHAAIKGQLTENWRNENTKVEPAITLLNRIKKEQEKTSKKVKKSEFSEIKSEEIPFELPKSWTWCRFSDLVDFQIGKTPASKQSNYWDNGIYNWLSISDMEHKGEISKTSKKITQKAVDETFKTQNIVPINTLLMSFKLTVGKVSINTIPLYHNEAIISIFPFDGVLQSFLFHLITPILELSKGKTVLMGQTFNSTSLAYMVFPLPPTEEQIAIVEKVEVLMNKCQKLSEEIQTLDKHEKTLIKAMFNETFENKAEITQE